MGVRFPSVGSTGPVNATLATNNETVVLTSTPLTLPLDLAQVFISWYVSLTVGTAGTSIQPRLRRGATAAGTILNTQPSFTAVAGNVVEVSGMWVDTPGAVAGQQYTLTLQCFAATANSIIGDACIMAFAL